MSEKSGAFLWLYFKIYVGEAAYAMDSLVTNLLPELVVEARPCYWFFLRYYDERGPHIRFRLNVPTVGAEVAAAAIERAISDAVKKIHYLPQGVHRPLIALDLPTAKRSMYTVGAEKSEYEPEFAKYGGESLIDLAHDAFTISSEVAIAVLAAERVGTVSRKSLAPILMNAALEAFADEEPAATFWQKYALFWLGKAPDSGASWIASFEAKADELSRSGISVLADRLDSVAAKAVEQIRENLAKISAAYLQAKVDVETWNSVRFNLCHLMNNRLGFNMIEEAYLACLMERATTPRALQ